MSRLNEREDKVSITNWLRMAKNSVMKFVDSTGVTHQLTTDELSTMTASGRGTTLVAATTITTAQNGATFFLKDADGFTVTLPAPTEGFKCRFIVGTAPTTAYIIVTNGSDNIIHGSVCSPEAAAVVVAAGADAINFVANLSVAGDYVEMESDGVLWYINGMAFVQDGMTTTQV